MCQLFPLPGDGKWCAWVCPQTSNLRTELEKAEKAETQMANVWAVLPGTSVFVTGSVSHATASAGYEPSALQMTEGMEKVVSHGEYKVQEAK